LVITGKSGFREKEQCVNKSIVSFGSGHNFIHKESWGRRRLKQGLAKSHRAVNVYAVVKGLGALKTVVAVLGTVFARRSVEITPCQKK
jgi:hypothetical protein